MKFSVGDNVVVHSRMMSRKVCEGIIQSITDKGYVVIGESWDVHHVPEDRLSLSEDQHNYSVGDCVLYISKETKNVASGIIYSGSHPSYFIHQDIIGRDHSSYPEVVKSKDILRKLTSREKCELINGGSDNREKSNYGIVITRNQSINDIEGAVTVTYFGTLERIKKAIKRDRENGTLDKKILILIFGGKKYLVSDKVTIEEI